MEKTFFQQISSLFSCFSNPEALFENKNHKITAAVEKTEETALEIFNEYSIKYAEISETNLIKRNKINEKTISKLLDLKSKSKEQNKKIQEYISTISTRFAKNASSLIDIENKKAKQKVLFQSLVDEISLLKRHLNALENIDVISSQRPRAEKILTAILKKSLKKKEIGNCLEEIKSKIKHAKSKLEKLEEKVQKYKYANIGDFLGKMEEIGIVPQAKNNEKIFAEYAFEQIWKDFKKNVENRVNQQVEEYVKKQRMEELKETKTKALHELKEEQTKVAAENKEKLEKQRTIFQSFVNKIDKIERKLEALGNIKNLISDSRAAPYLKQILKRQDKTESLRKINLQIEYIQSEKKVINEEILRHGYLSISDFMKKMQKSKIDASVNEVTEEIVYKEMLNGLKKAVTEAQQTATPAETKTVFHYVNPFNWFGSKN